MSYDSTKDTKDHIARVGEHIDDVIAILASRALIHDESKLRTPEKEAFDAVTPRLKELTYGSDEYRAELKNLGPALSHHYAHNSHHPEYYPDWIAGMSLLDLVEMICDWKAATERMKDGDIVASVEHNIVRFGIGLQLAQILRNTVGEMKW
jgi:hypothetical protein